ncbi:hypothetical protein SAMN06265337_3348 [Hymenobacter gelipurpurascens]|uniref:DUF2314 domain-containing protein n=1 Tax=Hymenobacter gelipurpurascens TaxID=89968 RepID=A0A212UDT7_9BACT|nr:hypothetical protein [Hymenobacter gelipurpurascens]SNC76363.1 hypothetical protein SAMN06265337_3348 [Hymenobacter gelipurpurascens]
MRYCLCLLLAAFLATPVLGQQPVPASIAALVGQLEQNADEKLPEAPLKEARRTFAQTRQRYSRGLPPGSQLYLTAQILNEAAVPEPVVVRVASWEAGRVVGHIVRLHSDGTSVAAAPAEFEEAAVLDWALLRPNGSEEGNHLGKFLELEERLAALSDH